jgi:hypothetical protein
MPKSKYLKVLLKVRQEPLTVKPATRETIKSLAKEIMEKVDDPNCSGTELRELLDELGKKSDELWGFREATKEFSCKVCGENLQVHHEYDGKHTVSRTLAA